MYFLSETVSAFDFGFGKRVFDIFRLQQVTCVITTLSRDVNGIMVHPKASSYQRNMTASGYLLTIKNLRI